MEKKASLQGIGEATNQQYENRNFDKQLAIHQEKISTLEKVSSDMETRVRSLEAFKWKASSIIIVAGIVLTTIIQIVIKKFL